MKKRLHDKKAGVAILISLIIISLAEVIFRAVAIGEAVLTTANLGEQLAVIALAVTILVLTAKGKDRACYIFYGAWAGYFILDQLFEFPGMMVTLIANISKPVTALSIGIHVITMVCIIAIGVLLVEYMCDKTIYNRAFNALCSISVLFLTLGIILAIYQLSFASVEGVQNVIMKKQQTVLVIFNNLYRIAMVFLFTFFAYDSAKMQLKKTNLTK